MSEIARLYRYKTLLGGADCSGINMPVLWCKGIPSKRVSVEFMADQKGARHA